MRKRILFTTIIASIVLCACAKENKTVTDDVSVEDGSTTTTEEAATEESSETTDTSEYDIVAEYNSYDEFIESIKKIMDIYENHDYDPHDVEQYGRIPYSIYWSIDQHADEFGYIQMDIDGDGVDELLLGRIGSEEAPDETDIDNMYTLKDGKVVPVFESEYYAYYQLYEDGMIDLHFSDSTRYCCVEHFKYTAGRMELKEGIYREGQDTDGKYGFHYYYSDSALQKREMTEKEYDDLRDELDHKYNKQKFKLHLFKEE
ncbi:MAG: hypothetical protein J5802_08275 [Butyrivibrio sp.]|nr:hypothetical protein [Butyrivibrio sp.]